MKILYLDLGMGAAGDMLAGALLALLDEPARADFLRRFNAAMPEGVHADALTAAQCGVTGLRFSVQVHGEEEHEGGAAHHSHHHHHGHAGLMEIGEVLAGMDLDDGVRDDVLAVYEAIAAAESEVHGVPVTEIHFHELGALDAVADITAVAMLLRTLGPVRVVASPVAVGSGTVRCAHGLLPVPAPATALLLRGIPALAGDLTGELCTPTGAALIGHFAAEYGTMPAMTAERVGCGFGTKEFPERPNCVRAVLGEAFEQGAAPQPSASRQGGTREELIELRCNLDDMTAEEIGFAMERIYAAGAVEAFTIAAGMKKNRPGVLLTALCRREERGTVLAALFAHTTTLGVREAVLTRYALERATETVQTALGPVRRKTADGFGVHREKWEYDDLARIARQQGMTIGEVRNVLETEENGR